MQKYRLSPISLFTDLTAGITKMKRKAKGGLRKFALRHWCSKTDLMRYWIQVQTAWHTELCFYAYIYLYSWSRCLWVTKLSSEWGFLSLLTYTHRIICFLKRQCWHPSLHLSFHLQPGKWCFFILAISTAGISLFSSGRWCWLLAAGPAVIWNDTALLHRFQESRTSPFMKADGGRSALLNTHIWRGKKSLQDDSRGAELWPAAVSNGWFNPPNKAVCKGQQNLNYHVTIL